MPQFSRKYLPASAEQIAAFERRFGVQLPAGYKKFLGTINGGTPVPNRFTVPGCGAALADFLYGIRVDRVPGDLEREQREASRLDPLPPGFLIIGHDPGGDGLLLSTSGEDAGWVYFWERSRRVWARAGGPNTFPVAKSFSRFLKSLREPPPEA